MYKNMALLILGVVLGSLITYNLLKASKKQDIKIKIVEKEKILTKYIIKEKIVKEINKVDKKSSFAIFKDLVKNQEYEKAFDIYLNKYASNELEKYNSFLFLHIDNLLKYNIKSASTLLNIIKQYVYDDFYFNYLEIKILQKEEKIDESFYKIVNLKNSYVPDKYLIDINNEFLNISRKFNNKLLKSQNIQNIEQFIFTIENNNINKYTLSLQKRIKLINQNEYLKTKYPIQIKLKKLNKHYLVPIVINNTLKLNLLLDTGASSTTIKKEYLKNIKYKLLQENMIFSTANGVIKSDLIEVNSIKISNLELNNFKLATLSNYDSKTSDGLLGQEFLNMFDWKIDQNNDLLLLLEK